MERLHHVATSDFGRVTYTEAIEILERAQRPAFEYPGVLGHATCRPSTSASSPRRYFKRPIFVTDYPKEIKAFYMRLNDDGKTVAAADCLVPGIGEIIGGSPARGAPRTLLERRIARAGHERGGLPVLPGPASLTAPASHAGFGLGFERLVMYLTGVGNIRDVIPHPRTVGNAEF